MTDYLNEFTPDWPHGHVVVSPDGTAKPFVVEVTDAPGVFPIRGHVVGEEAVWCFRADGGRRESSIYRLFNVALPEPEEELPKRFDIEEAKAALITCAYVYHALDWSSTPQGSGFWQSYFDNDLSPEDTARAREALRRWIAIAERGASK